MDKSIAPAFIYPTHQIKVLEVMKQAVTDLSGFSLHFIIYLGLDDNGMDLRAFISFFALM